VRSPLIFFSASFCSDLPPSPDFLCSMDFFAAGALECAATNFGFVGPSLIFFLPLMPGGVHSVSWSARGARAADLFVARFVLRSM
jgi:hypothetical protein